MDIRTSFPSKYLKAADISAMPGGTCRLKISHLAMETMENRHGEEEEKAILYFSKAKRGLVLNVTNSNVVAAQFGWETDAWGGHEVELYVATVEAFGKMVEAIRIRIPKAAAPVAPKKPGPQRHVEVMHEPAHEDVDADGVAFGGEDLPF